jgi:AraC-like DNA-binding protein
VAEVVETSDPLLAEQTLREAYGGDVRMSAVPGPIGFRMSTIRVSPSVRIDRLALAADVGFLAKPLGTIVISHLRSGGVVCRSGAGERGYRAGEVFHPVRPDHPHRARCTHVDLELVVIDPALPNQLADTGPGPRRAPVQLAGHEPVSTESAPRWKRTVAFVRGAAAAEPELVHHDLLAAGQARLLVAVALTAFPNNGVTDPTIEDRHDAHPGTLRRAVAFIDEHAGADIAVADIAAAAFVGVRAVQLAFRRHLDCTPMAYLRRVRLDHAHRELLGSDPATLSVTMVAARWGFGSPAGFAHAYSRTYGVPPSHTLHRRQHRPPGWAVLRFPDSRRSFWLCLRRPGALYRRHPGSEAGLSGTPRWRAG